ncbi:MAG: ROK family protein [Bacilli bacterium]|nr:ROK family protein [Bacilli bacterium]
MRKPILEPEFKPAIIELRNFENEVNKFKNKEHVVVSVERAGGYIYRREFDILPKGIDDERNIFIVERLIKCILWVVGGYKIYIAGPHYIYEKIKEFYSPNKLRDFDFHFMSTVFEKEMEVIECSYEDIPNQKSSSIPIGGHLEGRRIGFDVGGSDIKVSAVVDGKVIDSKEIVWLPKLNEDINYHYDFFYKAMKDAVDVLGGDVDAIGISAAGVIVENKPMVSSIFIKVPKENFDLVKGAYINTVHRLEKELGHKIPFEVANDGDVTALAGAIDLKDNCVLGIAMGTSEAVGYVDEHGNLTGWFSELAFMPVDFNKNAEVDEWSKDFGVGCKYFSQDAVIKLAPKAGIVLDESLTLADKLKVVQKLHEEGHEGAKQIFESIGVYLAYTIAFYAEFYKIKHLILLGRVTSNKGGEVILKVAKETLEKEFPEYRDIDIRMPSDFMRRLGQSIAAASLTENKA